MHPKPIAAGGSSFDLIDSPKLFSAIELKAGMAFLDVACGFRVLFTCCFKICRKTGHVYAVDLWKDGIDRLVNQITKGKISNIQK